MMRKTSTGTDFFKPGRRRNSVHRPITVQHALKKLHAEKQPRQKCDRYRAPMYPQHGMAADSITCAIDVQGSCAAFESEPE
jgi:hypothetical protein